MKNDRKLMNKNSAIFCGDVTSDSPFRTFKEIRWPQFQKDEVMMIFFENTIHSIGKCFDIVSTTSTKSRNDFPSLNFTFEWKEPIIYAHFIKTAYNHCIKKEDFKASSTLWLNKDKHKSWKYH